ncbi:M20/M25/M40 family metallo-hydrolase [uncultured Paludibaculum sp.]|uniref:M20/M25/M40 family metallo-hydrolase n=1 Tax=uncultured Paludibaculum sp. TaxID=1765020 RepID=UPI002AABF476|nr:M20/M25/M40 family metallo-hydrolase [uncultured Paludibaculum sp.]
MIKPLLSVSLLATAVFAQQPPNAIHPSIRKIASEVSEERIAATLKKLESFGTRDTNGVVEAPGRGIKAAREWIADQFKSYSPRLEVRFDPHTVKKSARLLKDTDVVNVVAVLKGKTQPEVEVAVGAHYDSMNMIFKPGPPRVFDAEATASAAIAPGVSDNGSGTALMLELARVMSQYEYDKTVVFIAFAGEEQGLLGAGGYAEAAEKSKEQLEAVINVDVIGNDVSGNGRQAGGRVNVYSADPMDSASRSLARYLREISERYQPELRIEPVFRQDRFGRGGDHTPFLNHGFAAVRVTTPTEQLEYQHNEKDTFDRVSVPYIAAVTRSVGVSLASLAQAPKPPAISPLSRGENHYDAVMKWKNEDLEPDLAGYAVTMRSTTAPFWEREIYVGKTEQFTLKSVSIDEVVLGVRAIDTEGFASLVTAWTLPVRRNFTGAPTAPAKPPTQ